MPIHQHPKCRLNGFSLIEVLIAIVVLAIGLLGIAGLQTVGVRQTLNSNLLTLASFQGNDMAERMRANREGVVDGFYDNISGDETDPTCLPACTPQQLAQYDAATWAQTNKTLLLDSSETPVTSTVVRNADGTFTISINWHERALPNEVDANNNPLNSLANSYSVRFTP